MLPVRSGLFGYRRTAVEALVAELERDLAAERERWRTAVATLEDAIRSAEAEVTAIEAQLAQEREDQRALLATLEAWSERVRVVVAQPELPQRELALLAEVAQVEAEVGRRRAFRAEVREVAGDLLTRLEALLRDHGPVPEGQAPEPTRRDHEGAVRALAGRRRQAGDP